jgi:2-(1,2-epoxy-1,2-dihydrophenyl)acetyl-CoA isomerase
MLKSFNRALIRLEAGGDGARCLVLTGEGRAFCSGANLTRTGAAPVPGEEPFAVSATANEQLTLMYHPLLRRLRDLPMPVLSLVNGPCVGVGMSFALSADMTVAADDAYFLQVHARAAVTAAS